MANLYDLKKFDLNLLVIFECIYQHLSISKAAETLHITPPAVSQSLQRLRNQLNDPLFIRSGKGITPTTVGTNLHIHLEQNLNQLEQTINITHASDLTKKFIIYGPQIITPGRLLNPLLLLIERESFEIEQHDITLSAESAEDLLAYRKADMVFTFFPVNNRSIVCTPFRSVKMVLVCRMDHPRIADSVTREQMLAEKHTQMASNEPGVQEFQTSILPLLPERTIAFRSDSFISIINIISASDLIGYIPLPIFETYASVFNLKKVAMPFELPQPQVFMLYNRASLNSKAFSDFITQIPID